MLTEMQGVQRTKGCSIRGEQNETYNDDLHLRNAHGLSGFQAKKPKLCALRLQDTCELLGDAELPMTDIHISDCKIGKRGLVKLSL
jgi:hypothetical protein